MGIMGNKFFLLGLVLCLVFSPACVSSAPISSSPARFLNGLLSNAASVFMKWLWSMKLKATTKPTVSGRSMVKYEGGYTVETVFDGSKLGVEPYEVEVLANGEILILDSVNSNLYRISSPLSLYSRPRLVAGSPDGYAAHVDGRLREARMNHPKGLTVDDRGNIYIADTMNMAIRKISDGGITTIAGGKWSHGGGHVDGPSEDAKFSDDFDVVYVGSSCSLLVIDRGNRAIREIQLHFDDCAYQYGNSFPIGIGILVGAAFFGYMLALLQHRVGAMVTSQNDQSIAKMKVQPSLYENSMKSMRPSLIPIGDEQVQPSLYENSMNSMRPLLTPTEDEQDKQEETFFGSLGKLFVNAGASTLELLRGIFPVFRKKPQSYHYESEQQQKHSYAWPVQESYEIPDEDEPPSLETKTPTRKKTYAFMSKDADKMHQLRQSRAFYSGWDDSYQKHPQKQQLYNQYHSSRPHTYYKQSSESTGEIVFGAVQEKSKWNDTTNIKPANHGDPVSNHQKISSWVKSNGYTHKY